MLLLHGPDQQVALCTAAEILNEEEEEEEGPDV